MTPPFVPLLTYPSCSATLDDSLRVVLTCARIMTCAHCAIAARPLPPPRATLGLGQRLGTGYGHSYICYMPTGCALEDLDVTKRSTTVGVLSRRQPPLFMLTCAQHGRHHCAVRQPAVYADARLIMTCKSISQSIITWEQWERSMYAVQHNRP